MSSCIQALQALRNNAFLRAGRCIRSFAESDELAVHATNTSLFKRFKILKDIIPVLSTPQRRAALRHGDTDVVRRLAPRRRPPPRPPRVYGLRLGQRRYLPLRRPDRRWSARHARDRARALAERERDHHSSYPAPLLYGLDHAVHSRTIRTRSGASRRESMYTRSLIVCSLPSPPNNTPTHLCATIFSRPDAPLSSLLMRRCLSPAPLRGSACRHCCE